jgi:hypothetical protein
VNVPRFRTTLALVIAPSAPALLFTFFVVLGAGLRGIVLGFYMVLLSALIGYPIALFAGLPLYLLRRRPRWIGTYVAGGAALGAGAAAVAESNLLGANPGAAATPSAAFSLLAAGAACGAFATASFWLIARPDRGPQIVCDDTPLEQSPPFQLMLSASSFLFGLNPGA